MKNVRKVDARAKLEGSFRFLDDYNYPEMLHGYLFYAKFHRGRLEQINLPTNFNLNEFTIVDYKDITGNNIVPEPECDQPYMAEEEIYHYGQIILGVAHQDKEILKKFIKAIEIVYVELPALTDIEACLEDESNAVGKEIVIDHRRFDEIPGHWIKTEGIYYTPHQEQAYLEPQGMIAIHNPEDRTMFVRGTMQCPYFVKSGVEEILGDAVDEVIIETSEGIGGAFGGKEDFPNIIGGITALLALKSGKPVKTVMDREDDIVITTKRHPSRIAITSWTDPKTQKLMKLDIDYRIDCGGYQTLSPVVLSRGVLHASGSYAIPDVLIRGRLLRSNTPSNGAFRGFGAPQAFFAIESHIDNIASEMNLDPLAFRRNNIIHVGDELPSSQPIVENHQEECLEKVLINSDYERKVKEFAEYNKTHNDKKGIGLSIGYHGGGYTGNGEKVLHSEIKLVIEKDATVKIYVANTDMGQGIYTTLAQMVNEALGHPLKKTIMQVPNTSKAPNSGPTVASRTIYIIGNLLKELAGNIKSELGFDNLEAYVQDHQDQFPREFRHFFTPDPSVKFDEETYQGIGYKDYSWAACVAEVSYDPITYKVKVDKLWNVLDIGRTVNRTVCEGQVEGGIIQAMGYALTEYFYKPGFGRMHGFTDYVLPITFDIPTMDIDFIHTDNTLAKGLGEVPMDYPAPAIRNAFLNATGLRLDAIPLTPENIFEAMQNNSKKG